MVGVDCHAGYAVGHHQFTRFVRGTIFIELDSRIGSCHLSFWFRIGGLIYAVVRVKGRCIVNR